MIHFSSQQKEAIRKGSMSRQSMIRETEKAVKLVSRELREGEKQDTILFGTTGIGKTFNVEKAVKDLNVPYTKIQGNMSIFAFGGNLMVLHSMIPKGQKMVIIIDDCDTFFSNKDTINILKAMTGKPSSRVFQYNKKVNEHMFTDLQNQLMSQYQNEGQHGFSIPCDDFIFIFTTNFPLPYDKDANEAQQTKGGSAAAVRKMDLAAIRSRTNTKDFLLDKETNWGWIAYVALDDGGLHMLENEQDKIILLDWMWNNWNNMKETNIRTIEKMAYDMIDYPETYRDNWEYDFLNLA
jgi:hypothetical protein